MIDRKNKEISPVESSLIERARQANMGLIDTAHLMLVVLEDPDVKEVFAAAELSAKTFGQVIRAYGWVFETPEPKVEPPKRSHFSFFRPKGKELPPTGIITKPSPMFIKVAQKARVGAAALGAAHPGALDYLQVLLTHEPSAVNLILVEDLKIEQDKISKLLKEIDNRRQIRRQIAFSLTEAENILRS